MNIFEQLKALFVKPKKAQPEIKTEAKKVILPNGRKAMIDELGNFVGFCE